MLATYSPPRESEGQRERERERGAQRERGITRERERERERGRERCVQYGWKTGWPPGIRFLDGLVRSGPDPRILEYTR
jgi:hypothetical protein